MPDGSGEQSKRRSCLMTHADMLDQMIACQSMGCLLDWDKDAGTLQIRHDDRVVVRAIQKGSKVAAWIVTFFNTATIKWEHIDVI